MTQFLLLTFLTFIPSDIKTYNHKVEAVQITQNISPKIIRWATFGPYALTYRADSKKQNLLMYNGTNNEPIQVSVGDWVVKDDNKIQILSAWDFAKYYKED
jgi:hypothetical protein